MIEANNVWSCGRYFLSLNTSLWFIFFYCCSGTRIKTRKRNIAAPLDPAAFADAVVQIYLDNAGDLVRVKDGCISILFKCVQTQLLYLFGHMSVVYAPFLGREIGN